MTRCRGNKLELTNFLAPKSLYGGVAPKFCMFHKLELLPLRPVEHTKLRSCTSVEVDDCQFIITGRRGIIAPIGLLCIKLFFRWFNLRNGILIV